MCLYLFRHLSIYLRWKIAYIIHLERIFNDSLEKKAPNTLVLKSPKNADVIAWMNAQQKPMLPFIALFILQKKDSYRRDAMFSAPAALINYISAWRSALSLFPCRNNRFLCSMTHDIFFWLCVCECFFHLSFVCNPFLFGTRLSYPCNLVYDDTSWVKHLIKTNYLTKGHTDDSATRKGKKIRRLA